MTSIKIVSFSLIVDKYFYIKFKVFPNGISDDVNKNYILFLIVDKYFYIKFKVFPNGISDDVNKISVEQKIFKSSLKFSY